MGTFKSPILLERSISGTNLPVERRNQHGKVRRRTLCRFRLNKHLPCCNTQLLPDSRTCSTPPRTSKVRVPAYLFKCAPDPHKHWTKHSTHIAQHSNFVWHVPRAFDVAVPPSFIVIGDGQSSYRADRRSAIASDNVPGFPSKSFHCAWKPGLLYNREPSVRLDFWLEI